MLWRTVSVSTHLAEASADIGRRVEDVKTHLMPYLKRQKTRNIEAGVEKREINKNVKAANDILLSSKAKLAEMVESVREQWHESEFASKLISL